MADRIIEITHEPFNAGFDVKVIPPVPDEPMGAEFPSHKQAFGFASSLRTAHGWRIIDRTCLGDGIGK